MDQYILIHVIGLSQERLSLEVLWTENFVSDQHISRSGGGGGVGFRLRFSHEELWLMIWEPELPPQISLLNQNWNIPWRTFSLWTWKLPRPPPPTRIVTSHARPSQHSLVGRTSAWSHTVRQWQHDRFQFPAPAMPACRYVGENSLATMLATKRSVGIAPEVCVTCMLLPSTSGAPYSGFET